MLADPDHMAPEELAAIPEDTLDKSIAETLGEPARIRNGAGA